MNSAALFLLSTALGAVGSAAPFTADHSGTPRPRRMRSGTRFGEHVADAEDLTDEDRERAR